MMRSIIALSCLLLATLASQAQDAPDPNAPPLLKPVRVTRFVPSGEKRTVSFLATLFPDCSSRGPVSARLLTPPERGKIEFVQGDSFTTFNTASSYATCNSRKTQGLIISYESEAGYTGEDSAKLFVIYPDGWAGEWTYTFIVK